MSVRMHTMIRITLLALLVASPWVGAQVTPQPRLGEPLDGLTPSELNRFDLGKLQFDRVFQVSEGLGPVFNQNSCSSCHSNPVGGSGSITVTHFGENTKAGFDPLVHLGGSLLQSQAISLMCQEVVPPAANHTAQRVTPSILGFGLLEAIPDADLIAIANNPPASVSGAVHMVQPLESPMGPMRVGRFGWKAQVATVLSFSGDAALNEMGITNRLVPNENAPQGNAALLAQCDTVPDPEDNPGPGIPHFIDRITDFQRYLAAPPQTPKSGMDGEVIFAQVGCTDCHTPSFTTSNDMSLEPAIRNKVIKPYSDFLLHDMGQAADFIPQGTAQEREIRTPPLWGLRVRDPIWHDGRVSGGTLADRIMGPGGIIEQHNALLSEAAPSAQAFLALSSSDKNSVIRFLDSLGRAEFDSDGDNDVDYVDLAAFEAARTGPGSFYTPNDPQAIHDIDQDGDVDDDDFNSLVLAFTVDCNGNGTNDLVDILVNGTSFDANGNLVPDECEHCQTDLGFAGPIGNLSLTVCGDPLTASGSMATALLTGLAPNETFYIAFSSQQGNLLLPGGGTVVPAFPLLGMGTFVGDADGRFGVTLMGGGSPQTFVLQAATLNGGVFELSNAVLIQSGM